MRALLLSTFALAAFSLASQAQGQEQTGFDLTFSLDTPILAPQGAQTAYAMLRLDGLVPDVDGQRADPPVHIALVLDRSGSMGDGRKWPNAISGAETLIDALNENDRLSIIGFDNSLQLAWPSSPMINPEAAKRALNTLYPAGGTNISLGLSAAAAQLSQHEQADAISHIVLLSDGQANDGITGYEQAHVFAQELDLPISSLGLGLGYDERYMTALAQGSAGTSHFIENPDALAAIFENEIQEAAGSVATALAARFIGSPGVTVALASESDDTDPELEAWSIGNLRTGASKAYLLEFNVDPSQIEGETLGVLQLTYVNLDGQEQQIEVPLTFTTSEQEEERIAAQNADVVFEAVLAEAQAEQAQAIEALRLGDQALAISCFTAAADMLSAFEPDNESQAERRDVYLEGVNVELARAENFGDLSLDEQNQIYKTSSSRLYNLGYGKDSEVVQAPGSTGSTTIQLNQALIDGGYLSPEDLDVNSYGAETQEAVRAYQEENNLTVDGIAGPETLSDIGLY